MRVVGGACRGRILRAPKGRDIRPTADRVREALFGILGDSIVDRDFLDLFAGTGAVGIEALSRGARRAVFVESDQRAIEVLRKNIEACRLSDRAEVRKGEVLHTVSSFSQKDRDFACIFADPPYGFEEYEMLLKTLEGSGLVIEESMIVIEHAYKKGLADHYGSIVKTELRRYGDTCLGFFQRT